MDAQFSRFNQILLVVLVVLYVVSLGVFTYANWMVEPEHVLWSHVVNALILSLPLILFFGSIYVLINAWREARQSGQFSARLAKTIHWAPRIAALVISFFVSLFSLDVFGMEGTPLELLLGFIMHSIPSIFMILMLVIAWRRPVVGAVAFFLGGLIFFRFVVMGGGLGHFLLFSGPLLLIAALFYTDYRWNKPLPPTPQGAAV